MSGSSSGNACESEDETSGWLMPSETSLDDGELSDELTLLNGDEDRDEDDSSFEALIKLSLRLKREYNLREASVELERCDKIWDTMQLVKKMQMDYDTEGAQTGDDEDDEDDDDDDDEEDDDEKERKYSPPAEANSAIPYIKYQPVQGNGNKALPNFYLAVKSQQMLYHCVTCGKQYTEKRSLRQHAQRDHGIVLPRAVSRKSQRNAESKPAGQDPADGRFLENGSGRERDGSKSRLSDASKHSGDRQSHGRPFVQPGASSASEEGSRAKPYACPVCGAKYGYHKGMTNHMTAAHDMTLADIKAICIDVKPPVRSKNYASWRRDIEVQRETSRVKMESFADGDSSEPSIHEQPKKKFIFTCKSCGRTYRDKKFLRIHARKIHNNTIPLGKGKPLSCDGPLTHFNFYTRHLEISRPDVADKTAPKRFVKQEDKPAPKRFVKQEDKPAPKRVVKQEGKPAPKRVVKQEDKTVWYRTLVKQEEALGTRTMRSGRKIREERGADRPRRSCAMKTSYTECTREEEEVLQQELVSACAISEAAGPSSSQPATPCFLCKKSYVDIRKHLIDYHRINCPETILPLAVNTTESEKDSESVASSEIESAAELATKRKTDWLAKKREYNEKARAARKAPSPRVSTSPRGSEHKIDDGELKIPGGYRCNMCAHKFRWLCHLRKHQNHYKIDGVLQPHPKPVRRRMKGSDPEDPLLVDPLALTDCAESSRSESRGNASDEYDADAADRKRRISSSDERLSSSSDDRSKRRKTELPNPEFVSLGSAESTSNSAAQYSNERETVIVMSETIRGGCSLDEDQDEPAANPRDTRDSSDRDSGIGISITIKKRNNSYEVVENSGDDDKSKDFEHSKYACSDSSSDAATPVATSDAAASVAVFVNDGQEARRREILNSLDYSAEESFEGGTARNDCREDEAPGTGPVEEMSCSSDEKEAKFCWKDAEHRGEESLASSPGEVPSLRVMCRTVLRRDDDSSSQTSGDTAEVRRCTGERDTMAHTLERKVN